MMKSLGSITSCKNQLKIWLLTWTSFQDQLHQKLIFMATRVSNRRLGERGIDCLKKEETQGKKELWQPVETKLGFLVGEEDIWKLHRALIIFKIHQTQTRRLLTKTCQAICHKEIIFLIKVLSIAITWCLNIYRVSNLSKSLTVWSLWVALLYLLEESKVLLRGKCLNFQTDLWRPMHLMHIKGRCLIEQCIRARQDLLEGQWIWQLFTDKAWLPLEPTC